MDVKQIHNALITIWPGGIPREGLVYLAGMIKAITDKAQEGLGIASTAQTEMEQALASSLAQERPTDKPSSGPYVVSGVDTQDRSITLTLTATPTKDPIPAPTAPKGRGVPAKILARIKNYLRGATASQRGMVADLGLGPWTVKRAVWQLQREGAILRTKAVQGPHLYQLAKVP